MGSKFDKVSTWVKRHPIKTVFIVFGTVTTGYVLIRFVPQILGAIATGASGVSGSRRSSGENARTSTNSTTKTSNISDDINLTSTPPSTDTSAATENISEKSSSSSSKPYSALKPGRCQKHSDCNTIRKNESGIYRIKAQKDVDKYIGKSIDMQRRCKEHANKGLFIAGEDTFETLAARENASNGDLYAAEKEQIRRHSPILNKTAGGNGR
ncbi:GIY-YIG nuclease family protein [Shewanella mangrovisoli]|uniref:GIY-YIG nuclease family protein n=1 Tax=Shewanella mangrovisoli TaxID=2864211 RepID=UPI0035B95F69